MITAQIATIPDREDMLRNTVASLLPQVDKLNVMLNGYSDVPYFCKDGKISNYLLDNSTGDSAKFMDVYDDGYLLSCDDDLIYPPDYAQIMTEWVDQTNGIVSIIGKVFKEKPINTFYGTADRLEAYHWNKDINGCHRVHVGGSGVMCFHTDRFRPRYKDFLYPNMADIWIAKFAHEQGIPINVVPHLKDWLIYQNPPLPMTVWGKVYFGIENDSVQTKLYNSF